MKKIIILIVFVLLILIIRHYYLVSTDRSPVTEFKRNRVIFESYSEAWNSGNNKNLLLLANNLISKTNVVGIVERRPALIFQFRSDSIGPIRLICFVNNKTAIGVYLKSLAENNLLINLEYIDDNWYYVEYD